MRMNSTSTVAVLLLSVIFLPGCGKSSDKADSGRTTDTSRNSTGNETTRVKPNDDGTIPSGTGVEKEKPAPGTGNVQGKVLYNGKPAEGIEVKLCEKFSQYLDGCSGESYTTRTDGNGEYLIKNVVPKMYEALTAKVFDTPFYVFATSGYISAAKYRIEADKTYFAPINNLFKNDLKLLSPKAGSKVGSSNTEVKWAEYPDAAYYKFSINAGISGGGETEYDYINKRVDGLSYTLDKPLKPGTYSCTVSAFNGNDIKLAQSPDDIEFTVTSAAGK
ncbi:MAG: hypothetical protein JWQ98_2215 [Chlorobi bacterium]|nr:hypothetical protein [Chlorobiota bacterium]